MIDRIFSIFNQNGGNVPNEKKLSAFHDVVRGGMIPEINKFLDKYPDAVNMPGNYYGMTALMYAAQCRADNVEEVVDLLIKRGADIDKLDRNGQNVLFHANSLRELELFIARNANIRTTDKDGCTPLMRFALGGRNDVTEAMIRHGAEIDAVDAEGKTALLLAAEYGEFECVQLLLAARADVKHTDNKGKTALHLAAMRDGPNSNKRSEMPFRRTVRRLLSAGADIHATDKEGKAVLHHAIGTESPPLMPDDYFEMIRLLINSGANRDLADASKITPMVLAQELEHEGLLAVMYDGYKRPPPTTQKDRPFNPPPMP